MWSIVTSFFTGSSSVWKVGCIALGVALLSLSIYSGVKIASLHVENAKQKSEHAEAIKTLKKEQKEAIEALNEKITSKEAEIKKLSEALAQRNADIQTQNALIEQNRVDIAAKEKAFKEAMSKKPKIVTDIKYIPKGDDECTDLKAIIDEYIATGAQQ